MMFVGPGWMNKMGRWEQPYELLYNLTAMDVLTMAS